MPLYDPDNALSAEAPALEALGVLLANTAGFRRLVEVGDEFEAAEKVLVGPWDAEQDQDDHQNQHNLPDTDAHGDTLIV